MKLSKLYCLHSIFCLQCSLIVCCCWALGMQNILFSHLDNGTQWNYTLAEASSAEHSDIYNFTNNSELFYKKDLSTTED